MINSDTALLSVIVPVFNEEKHIQFFLAKLYRQLISTDKKIEVSRKEHDMEFKILTTAALLISTVIKLDS